MIPSEFLPWMIAFLSISLLFIVFAIFLCCVLGENYNSFRAKIERRGNLQKARNLIKLVSLGYVKTNPVILADKNTQISRFLLNNLNNHSSKKIKFELESYSLVLSFSISTCSTEATHVIECGKFVAALK